MWGSRAKTSLCLTSCHLSETIHFITPVPVELSHAGDREKRIPTMSLGVKWDRPKLPLSLRRKLQLVKKNLLALKWSPKVIHHFGLNDLGLSWWGPEKRFGDETHSQGGCWDCLQRGGNAWKCCWDQCLDQPEGQWVKTPATGGKKGLCVCVWECYFEEQQGKTIRNSL